MDALPIGAANGFAQQSIVRRKSSRVLQRGAFGWTPFGGRSRRMSPIAAAVRIYDAARTFGTTMRARMELCLDQHSRDAVVACGCRSEFDALQRYPALVTHPAQMKVASEAALQVSGAPRVDLNIPQISADNFTCTLESVAGARVLVWPRRSWVPEFDFNGLALSCEVAFWLNIVALGGPGL